MTGKTHVALGLLASLVSAIYFLNSSLVAEKLNTVAIIIAVIGALLPDLDMGTSSLGSKFGIVKRKHIEKIWIMILIVMLICSFIFLKIAYYIRCWLYNTARIYICR